VDNPSRHEVNSKVSQSAAELRADMADIRKDMYVGFANISAEFSRVRAEMSVQAKDLIKWFIGLTVSVGSIVLTALLAIWTKIDAPPSTSAQMAPIIINVPAPQSFPTEINSPKR